MSLIKDKRKEIGITQLALARQLKVSRITLASWEERKTTPAMNKIELLAKLLRVPFVTIAKDYINKEEL